MGERALITGASGFIGPFLAETLAQRGTSVHCLLRPSRSIQHLHNVLGKIHIHTHACTILGWKPRVTLNKGIQKMVLAVIGRQVTRN